MTTPNAKRIVLPNGRQVPRPKIGLAIPAYSTQIHLLAAAAFFRTASLTDGTRYDVIQLGRVKSLLANCFNQLWAEAIAARERAGLTHFGMLHSDVIPEPRWLDVLWDELARLQADVVSAVIPIKDDRGLTSTAIGDPADPWNVRRRLTMREVFALPETFSIQDCIAARLAKPGDALLVNTGCWLANLRRPWVTAQTENGVLKVRFSIEDRIRWENGGPIVDVIPEDWFFSYRLSHQNCHVYATRKLILSHAGERTFSNDRPWGEWEIDQDAHARDQREGEAA